MACTTFEYQNNVEVKLLPNGNTFMYINLDDSTTSVGKSRKDVYVNLRLGSDLVAKITVSNTRAESMPSYVQVQPLASSYRKVMKLSDDERKLRLDEYASKISTLFGIDLLNHSTVQQAINNGMLFSLNFSENGVLIAPMSLESLEKLTHS